MVFFVCVTYHVVLMYYRDWPSLRSAGVGGRATRWPDWPEGVGAWRAWDGRCVRGKKGGVGVGYLGWGGVWGVRVVEKAAWACERGEKETFELCDGQRRGTSEGEERKRERRGKNGREEAGTREAKQKKKQFEARRTEIGKEREE